MCSDIAIFSYQTLNSLNAREAYRCLTGKAQPLVDQCSHSNRFDPLSVSEIDIKGKCKRIKSGDSFFKLIISSVRWPIYLLVITYQVLFIVSQRFLNNLLIKVAISRQLSWLPGD